jgi:hypothetical protein
VIPDNHDFFVEWSGINALLYYGPTLMHELGLQGDTVTLMVSGGIGIVQFIAVFPVILYIDRLGKSSWAVYHTSALTDCYIHRSQASPSMCVSYLLPAYLYELKINCQTEA